MSKTITNCCYKCEDRKQGCHSKCESYAEYVKQNEQLKANRRKNHEYYEYQANSIAKHQRDKRNHRLKRGAK